MKQCTGCKERKDEKDFYLKKRKLGYYLESRCKTCQKIRGRAWKKAHPEQQRAQKKKWKYAHREDFNGKNGKNRKYLDRLKEKFLSMYGKTCSCCGESEKKFLTVEHVQGQSGKKKKENGTRSLVSAIKEYRPDIYDVLCFNCNCAKGFFGECPHKA